MRLRLAAVPGVVLVAVAAAMWGTDPIIRKTMSFATSATTIVFGEHVILAALTLPFLLPALRAVFRAGWSYVVAAVVVGAGASAVATILFTDALIGHSDFITPVVIQKVQPLVAVAGAGLLLGERARPTDHGGERLLERARHVSDSLPRARDRTRRAHALLLRAAANSGSRLLTRGAHLSRGRRDRRHLRVQPTPALDAVARRRRDPRRRDAAARAAAPD